MCLQEAQRRELRQKTPIEVHLRGLVPSLDHHVRMESRFGGPTVGGAAVSTLDLVGEQQEQDVFERQPLLLGKTKALRQRVEDLAEAQALERSDELGADGPLAHGAPPSSRPGWRVANVAGSRANRATGRVTTRPSRSPSLSILVAALSIRSIRPTSSTPKARERLQSASTLAFP